MHGRFETRAEIDDADYGAVGDVETWLFGSKALDFRT